MSIEVLHIKDWLKKEAKFTITFEYTDLTSIKSGFMIGHSHAGGSTYNITKNTPRAIVGDDKMIFKIEYK